MAKTGFHSVAIRPGSDRVAVLSQAFIELLLRQGLVG